MKVSLLLSLHYRVIIWQRQHDKDADNNERLSAALTAEIDCNAQLQEQIDELKARIQHLELPTITVQEKEDDAMINLPLTNYALSNTPLVSFFAAVQKQEDELSFILKDALLNSHLSCKLSRKQLEVFYDDKTSFVTQEMIQEEANVLFIQIQQALENSEIANLIKSMSIESKANTLTISCHYSMDAEDLLAYLNDKGIIKTLHENAHLKGQLSPVLGGKDVTINYAKKVNYLSEEAYLKKTAAILCELQSFLAKSGFNDLAYYHYSINKHTLICITQYTIDAQELADFLGEVMGVSCENLAIKPK